MLRTARILLALTAGLFSGPEGAEAAHTDGYAVTQTLNARQLPEVLRTTKAGAETPVWLSYGYDSQRKITSVADLDGAGANEGRSYGYDANGRLLTAAGPWGTNGAQVAGSLKYDALGNIREQKLGTRTIAISYHAAANRVSSANNGGVNRAYGYDARGKVTQLVNWAVAGEDRSFGYDANGRLVSSTGPWGSGSYVYDALGNMRQRNEGMSGSSTINYASNNRVSSATVNGTGRTYTYDNRGNTTSIGATGFAYDYANQPVTVTGTGAATFLYDGNFKRVKDAGKTIYTIYSRVTGGLLHRDQATDAIKTEYASAGGASFRLKKTGTAAAVPEYLHADHLGTPIAATDATGAVTWRESYQPFGKALRIFGSAPANDNNTGFTGHLEDDASGLVYMQARHYDPLIGRFLSTDPIGYQDQLNLYAYVANDPVNTTDPTGECPWCVFGAVVGGGIQAVAEVNKGSFSNGALSKQGLQALGRIAISAGAGALGGGVATAAAKVGGAGAAAVAARIGANAAGGAAIGAAQNTANAGVEGRLPTSSEVASGAAMGAAFSGGGAALGEAVDAAGKALASSATAGQSAAQMSDAMVNGAQAPAGMHVQGLYPAATQHPASVGGAVLGNAASGAVANSGPLVGGGSPSGCSAGSSQEKC